MSAASRFFSAVGRMLRPRPRTATPAPRVTTTSADTGTGAATGSATFAVAAPGAKALTVSYAPSRDDQPDAGEIVWTWVPYDENDGRGKDRPVLVIARHGRERVYAVRLTSQQHDRDRDYVALGAGDWDGRGRPSWVDIEQVYSVHPSGMRREAAALDRRRFDAVAKALQARYGWRAG